MNKRINNFKSNFSNYEILFEAYIIKPCIRSPRTNNRLITISCFIAQFSKKVTQMAYDVS